MEGRKSVQGVEEDTVFMGGGCDALCYRSSGDQLKKILTFERLKNR